MTTFSCLWVGRDLEKIEVLSLSSYLYHGHTINLYVYDDIKNIPNGVNILDGNSILKKDCKYIENKAYAKFSDTFRYHVVKKTKTFWTDLDAICLRSDWNFNKKYVYCVNDKQNLEEYISGGVFKIEDDQVLDYMIERTNRDINHNDWSEFGPKLITEAVNKFSLQKYILPSKAFVPINFRDWEILWDPNKYNTFLNLTKNSYCVHVFNEMANKSKIDRNFFPKKSALDVLYKKYVC
jgi:hypothetical protein